MVIFSITIGFSRRAHSIAGLFPVGEGFTSHGRKSNNHGKKVIGRYGFSFTLSYGLLMHSYSLVWQPIATEYVILWSSRHIAYGQRFFSTMGSHLMLRIGVVFESYSLDLSTMG